MILAQMWATAAMVHHQISALRQFNTKQKSCRACPVLVNFELPNNWTKLLVNKAGCQKVWQAFGTRAANK
jgi:hypothetical protein